MCSLRHYKQISIKYYLGWGGIHCYHTLMIVLISMNCMYMYHQVDVIDVYSYILKSEARATRDLVALFRWKLLFQTLKRKLMLSNSNAYNT